MDRWPVLNGIRVLLKILAVLMLVAAFFGGIAINGELGGGTMLVVWIVAAGYAIGLWAFAELIGVMLAIEENTRRTSDNVVSPSRASGVLRPSLG